MAAADNRNFTLVLLKMNQNATEAAVGSTSSEKSETASAISTKLNKLVASDLAGWLLLISFFFIVAAAAHSGFFAKWSLRDMSDPSAPDRYSVDAILDGTAHKPFVYRQFVPALANAADHFLPSQLKDYVVRRLNPSDSYARALSSNRPSYEFRYRMIYSLHFLALFLSLFFLRSIVLSAGGGQMEASFASTAFVLAFPYLQTIGGYFYDAVELAFLSAAVLAVLKGKYILLIALAAVATYNKESFFFYVLTLYPLLRFQLDRKRTIAVLLPALLVSGLVNLLLKMAFLNSDGGAVEFHLWQNLRNYLLPWFYGQLDITYGVPGPRGTFFLTLIAALLIVIRGWFWVPGRFRLHAMLCFLINFPLFLLFCATGELRNLSFLYVPFVVFLSFSIKLYSADKEGMYLKAA